MVISPGNTCGIANSIPACCVSLLCACCKDKQRVCALHARVVHTTTQTERRGISFSFCCYALPTTLHRAHNFMNISSSGYDMHYKQLPSPPCIYALLRFGTTCYVCVCVCSSEKRERDRSSHLLSYTWPVCLHQVIGRKIDKLSL